MLRSKSKRDVVSGRVGDGVNRTSRHPFPLSPLLPVFFLMSVSLFATGCRRDMQDQPKMKPYRATTFFQDGLSGRQPVEGTIPRGYLRTDTALYTGKKTKLGPAANAAPNPQTPAAATGQNPYPDDIEIFPLPITKDIVEWGRQRYDIFCAVCHGKTGNGDGMIARRGFRRAASFHDDRLRQAPWATSLTRSQMVGSNAIVRHPNSCSGSLGNNCLCPGIATQQDAGTRYHGSWCCGFAVANTRSRTQMMLTSFNPPDFSVFQKRALIACAVFLLVLVAGVFLNAQEFFRAYLIGWTFWTGIAVGSLALLMLQHLTGGGWGLVIRRVLEAATRTLPLMALLFIPIVLGAHSLYSWTHAEELRTIRS